ncbi:MAG: glycoside hydrolase [Verrucomicrobia bacterium]|nr:glycoside hydrolase [Verrucomicrobiota bacterium]
MKHLLILCGCLAALSSPVARAERPADPDRVWQGIPGLERSAGGRVFLSWFSGGPKEPAPENEVLLCWSDDGAKTFNAPQVMAAPVDGSRCYDPTLWIDPKGRLWYIFNRGNKDTAQHDVRARICAEPDAERPVFGAEFRVGYDVPFAFRMNKVTVLSSGEWVMPVTLARNPVHAWSTGYDDRQEPTLHGVGISTDEGKIWKLHGAVKSRPWALENMIVELKDGRLWMLIRTSAGVLWQSHSADKGRTWSAGRPSEIASPGSRFFIRRLASGNLLLVNHHRFSGRSHLTARLSTDDGATWNDGLLLDERAGVSYPDGAEDRDGLIRITYDRDRGGAGEILLATFKEEDVRAGRDVSGAVRLKQVVNRLDKPSLVPRGWDPALAGDRVMGRLIRVTPPQAKGAHDAEFVCVGERAYIVEHDNDLEPGHGAGAAMYCVLTVVNLKTLRVEKTYPLAKAGERFANVTLPNAEIFVPRVIRKDEHTLRTYFCSQPAREQAVTWYRDFDLRANAFAPEIHKARLKTSAGTFDMEPRHFHADAAARGFTKPAVNNGLYIFDSFKEFDGRIHVALNNFPGKQNALAVLQDDYATFEVIGHYNEPLSRQLSESAVNRLPDGTWMAICRDDSGNYHFTTSRDGKTWTVAEPKPFVPNGLNSKPTFDRFGGVYYLGWQENTRIGNCNRSVFNVDISRDGKTWQRKYRFETPHSFQYPTFHEHEGTIWLSVTQSDHGGSSDRIMFGKLETTGEFEAQKGLQRIRWPAPPPPPPALMKPGVKLFTDREYVIAALPDAVRDLPFHRTGIEKTEVEVKRAGTLFALSPTPRPGAASQEAALLRAGFTKVEGTETQLFPGEINRVTLYRKEAGAGERLRFAKMVVLIAGPGAELAGREAAPPGPWAANDGETLPNGIVLPKVWPPDHREPDSAEPMPVPYLRDPPPVIPIDVGRQLFTDDFLIEETTLRRTFHQAEKFGGNPVFRAETPRELGSSTGGGEPANGAVTYLGHGGLFFDPGERRFQLFYTAGWRGPFSLATSPDLKTWTRQGELLPEGLRWTGPRPAGGGSDNCVWLDLNARTPEERLKYLTCWEHVPVAQRPPGFHHSLQVSDGKTWSDAVPTTSAAGDYCSFFHNPFRGKWVFSIKRGTSRGRSRFYFESDDFLQGGDWQRDVYWTGADRLDAPEPLGGYPGAGDAPQLYTLNAVAYESLMIGLHAIHRGPENGICSQGGFPKLTDLELGFSRDGFHWDRPDRRGFLRGSRVDGAWDRAYLHGTAGVMVILDDALVFPYCGFSGLAPDGRRGMYSGAGIGLATLRRDGFASLDGPGRLTTRPVKFQGKHLFMNLDGEVRVEVLDEEGKLLAESPPQTVDSTKRRIGWTGRADLAAFAGMPIRFRFHLGKGALYAFWVTSDEGGASHGYVGAGGPAFQGTRDLGEP